MDGWKHAIIRLILNAQLNKVMPLLALATFLAQNHRRGRRLVRQRVGQQAFRHAMLDYWGGTCAVTGVAVPQALRASHAKAWALCATDAERLDVCNGFLLSANLDALFDAYLVTFLPGGELVVSPAVPARARVQLGMAPDLRLRWLDERHQPYLAFHRSQCGWLNE